MLRSFSSSARYLILGLFFYSQLVFAQSYPINPDQDILHYTFYLNVNDSSNEIYGEASIVFTLKNQEELTLDFINRDAGDLGMVVDKISLAGQDLAFAHERNRLKIDIDSISNIPLEIVIKYHGIPANGLIIAYNKFGERVFFGDNYPDRARNWLPCVDHPADKATVTWIITAPDHYKVVASGMLVSEKPAIDGYLTTTWNEKVPISTKVMVFGAADFAVEESGLLRDIPVSTWVYRQNKDAGFNDFAIAPKVLTYFDSLIAPYPFEKLANVQSKTMYGGMENAGNIFYYENAVTGEGENESLIAHELVHQWFGNSATEKDWPHAWLSEGFATYLTHVYLGSRYGQQRMLDGLKKDRKRVISYWHNNPLPIVNTELVTFPQVANLRELLSTNTYQKAGWVLHILRNELGDEIFWQAVRTYYTVYKENVANTTDFRKIVEEVSGRDLGVFFNQWLFGEGQPTLDGGWSYSKGKVIVNIKQNQEQPFIFPLEIGLVYKEETLNKTVNITSASESFDFAEKKPDKIILDPNTKLLFEGSEVLNEKTKGKTAVNQPTLNGSWVLSKINAEEITSSKIPTMEFSLADKSIKGNGGCNNYQGTYQVKGKKLKIDENFISTRMMCEHMDIEDAFLKALAGQKFDYTIENNQLSLIKRGEVVLVFKKVN